jgi:hypothetical protein
LIKKGGCIGIWQDLKLYCLKMGDFKSSTISGHVMGVLNLGAMVMSIEETMHLFVDQINSPIPVPV